MVQPEYLTPDKVSSGGDGSNTATPMFRHVCEFYIAGSWQEDTLPLLPHPLIKTNPRSKCGILLSQHWRCSAMLTECWSCPCKTRNPPFPPGTVSVGGSNKALGPGTWSGATYSCHFQRAEGCHGPLGFPFSNYTT